MRFTIIVLVLIFGISIPAFCSSMERDEYDRQELNSGFKRARRTTENDESSLVNCVQSMSLSVPDFITSDPVLKYCYENIPKLTDREMYTMFDEAVFNEHLGMIKVFILHGEVGDLIDSDHIENLCRSRSELSGVILDLLLENNPFSGERLNEIFLASCLNYCVPHGLEKFKSFCKALKGESLSVSQLACVLSNVASYETKEFYDFMLSEIGPDTEEFRIVLKETAKSVASHGNSKVLTFLLENGLPVSILDRDQKIKMALIATRTNNPSLLSFLLHDRETLLGVSVIPKSPWIIAVYRDYPEVLDVFIKFIPGIQEGGLAMLAFSQKNRRVLEYFKQKGVLNDQILFRMAMTAIQSGDLSSLKFLKQFGIPFSMLDDSTGFNLLTTTVTRDLYGFVEFLIKECHMDANARNEKCHFDMVLTSSTPIYYAKSPKMVSFLAENGANVNAKHEKITHRGVMMRSTTALHKAAEDSNLLMFKALIENGADYKIPDSIGLTNEAFYNRNF